jgi:hypothetical protein
VILTRGCRGGNGRPTKIESRPNEVAFAERPAGEGGGGRGEGARGDLSNPRVRSRDVIISDALLLLSLLLISRGSSFYHDDDDDDEGTAPS